MSFDKPLYILVTFLIVCCAACHRSNVLHESVFSAAPYHEGRVDDSHIQHLIDHGGNVNQGDRQGNTPLHLACYMGYHRRVDLLIKNGANVNKKNDNGRTPLWYIIYGYRNVYESESKYVDFSKCRDLLLDSGANINTSDEQGRLMVDYAKANNSKAYEHLLIPILD